MDYFSPSFFALLSPLDWEAYLKHTNSMDFGKAFSALKEHEVQYLVIGGLAMNLHGIRRITGHLDLFVNLDSENIKRFLNAVTSLDCEPKPPVDHDMLLCSDKRLALIKDKNLRVCTFVSLSTPSMEIDIQLDPPSDFMEVHKRKKEIPFSEEKIPVLSLDDMIKWKSGSKRRQDIYDVESLKTVRKMREAKN